MQVVLKMFLFRVDAMYKQLFCPTGSRFNGSSQMSLEDGIKDIGLASETLEYVANHIPGNAKLTVGLGNCETWLLYRKEVSNYEGLEEPKEVLRCLFDLPQVYQPLHIHISALGYVNEVEAFLNQHHKTLYLRKAEPLVNPRVDVSKIPKIIRAIHGLMDRSREYGTLVREMK